MRKKVKIGSIGLGRLGYEHACNIASLIPEAELTALCDIDAEHLNKVADELGVSKRYTDYESLCKDPDLDAIAIVSPSALHVEQIECAMANGKHVFCEKPLGTDVPQCLAAEKVVAKYPELKFMLGFMRRFDDSYMDVKARIDRGEIGKVILMRSYTQDPVSTIESTLKFAPHSGGQFLDMCVHDLDLLRWFTGSPIKNLWAIGGVFAYDLYRKLNDGDNVAAMLQCENEAMGFIFAGRAAAHGCNVETEVIGTKGTLRIASVPAKNLVEIMSEHGVSRFCYEDFMARWHQAYINEIREFCRCIIENRQPDVTVQDGTAASEAAYRCKESFEKGRMLPLRD